MADAKKSKAAKKATTPPSEPGDLAKDLLDGILSEMGEGDGVVQLLGSDGLSLKIRGVISTQNAEIDWVIGRGGVPLGRLTIIHGKAGDGKTTLALHLVAEVQAMGGMAVYIDCEYKLDPDYAANINVDTDRLIISQPPYLERVFALIDATVKKAAEIRERLGRRVPILIVYDSMNASISKEMFEAESFDKKEMAGPARVFSSLLPRIMPLVSKEDVGLVFISQVRQKFGVMFGDDEELAGGNAPKFNASLILHVKRLNSEKEGEDKVGNYVRVEAKKNQIAPPFRKSTALIRFGKGFDREYSLLTRGEKLGIVKKSGATYVEAATDLIIGVGVGKARKALLKNPEWRDRIAAAILAAEDWSKSK